MSEETIAREVADAPQTRLRELREQPLVLVWLAFAVTGFGGFVGFFLAYAFACAEMLGAAEEYTPPNVPDGPSLAEFVEYLFVGSLGGACIAGVLGLIAYFFLCKKKA
jgi:hypothetical protein